MSDKQGGPAPAGDPSMEDILASIRRILSEDESSSDPASASQDEPARAPPATASHPPTLEKDVLILDPSMIVPEPPHSPDPQATAQPQHPPTTQPYHPTEPPVSPPPSLPPLSETNGLVAPAAAAAAASSVGALVRTLSERSTQVHRGGPTIEDIVRDEIRPILKDWLDHNLPPIVERLVRLEIERVVGRAVP
jgi:cell pole-organizing protein PopZ